MRFRWALPLAVLLVLAGCSGLSAENGPPDRTPYGVDDELEPAITDPTNETRGQDGERLVPGLSTAGVENASLLVDRHYEALESAAGNRTYVVLAREVWRAENGSEVRLVDGRFVVDAPNRWHRTVDVAEPPDSEPTVSEGWAEDGLHLLRYERPNGEVDYRALGGLPSVRPLERTLESILADADDATVEAETSDDTIWYRVTANVSDVEGVRNLVFIVQDDGRIHRVSYGSNAEHVPNASVSELQIQFEGLGPESLERPVWYDEALEETDAEPSGNETGDGTDEEASSDGSDDESPDEGADDDESSAAAQAFEAAARLLE